ncbi:MAG: metal-dependent hydrolase [Planctomycetia bacterium]|nr:metal-dependent hydrolase [Planctomycetia bacterium]
MNLQFLGHNAWLLSVDEYRILVDPFLTGNPRAAISADDVQADCILVTHGHGDHLGDTVALSKRTKATVVAMVKTASWLEKNGVKSCQGLNYGGSVTLDGNVVKMVPAWHTSTLPDGTNGGLPCGFVVRTRNGKNVYFAGDTCLFGDMQLLRRYPIDLACLPIGGHYTMDPEDALLAVKFLQPRVVIPCHYDTWPVIAQDAEAWCKRVEAETDTKCVVLPPGKCILTDD